MRINGYTITKRGKIAIRIILFLIVFSIFNVVFNSHKNEEIGSRSITLLNKQGINKDYEKKQNIIGISNNDPIVINAKTISDDGYENLKLGSKIPTDEYIETSAEVKVQATVNEQELSYTVESAYKEDGKKIAFLTFDDGPSSENTLKILDILRFYKIKATFFIIGSLAEKNKDILKAVVNDGHAIGNHTYSHVYNTIYSNVPTFISEIKRTDSILKDILGLGFTARIVRFPGGAFQNPPMKPFIKELNDEGYVNIDWNAINGDGEGNDIPADKLVKKLKDTALNQSHLVILMHDSSTKETSVEALPQIIEYLKAEAYEFATLK